MKVCECGHPFNIHIEIGCIQHTDGRFGRFCPCPEFIESFESLVLQALNAVQVQAFNEVTNEKES